MRSCLISMVLLAAWTQSACTVTSFQKRGDLSLNGTIFEGWETEHDGPDMSAESISGAFYECQGSGSGPVEFVCILTLPDGDKYDGPAFEEKVTVIYRSSGDLREVVVQTIKPPPDAEDHFRFRVEDSVAKGIESIKTSAPVKLSAK